MIATAHSAPRNPCAPNCATVGQIRPGLTAVRLSCEQEPGDLAELRDRADPPGVGLAPTEVAEDERQDERKHERVVALEERRGGQQEQQLAAIPIAVGHRVTRERAIAT
ncbi:MAG TPA: hypothetical protein VGQ50_06335 [Actinomycetota bacterium]|nr:hypothetical protein [Actinomycetota bacterium]